MRTLFASRLRSNLYVDDGPSGRVVLKVLSAEAPSPREVLALDNELEITRNLDIPGVRRALARERVDGRHALSLRFVEGTPLSSLCGTLAIDLDRFFDIAIQLTETLASLHERGVVHKDVKPANVLIDEGSSKITLIDFGISSRIDMIARELAPSDLEGTLAYMAPEQTGRVHRPIDARSDLYALGATFHELLSGHPPFESSDPAEVVHAHLARAPAPLSALVPSLPGVIASLVLRLLAKDPDDRYQTAIGLAHDLRRARAAMDAGGRIESFTLGAHDVSRSLRIPARLFGRDHDLEVLGASVRAVERGESACLLIGGGSGVGKSALVNEIGPRLSAQRGWFVAGKLELLGGEPHHALLAALRMLATSLLFEAESELRAIAQRMRAELEGQGAVLIELIPAIERVIGAQPEVPALAAAENQHRLSFVLRAYIRSVVSESRPLLIFLDDLQWGDRAALDLIGSLCADKTPGLMIVGAYRDNEVGATHPLVGLMDDLDARCVAPLRLTLRELDRAAVEELIAETLRAPVSSVKTLAELVHEKTGGNAFFVRQFLVTLHAEGALQFDTTSLAWVWDDAALKQRHVTANVAELVASRLAGMPDLTRRSLAAAACLGAVVHPSRVALLLDGSLRDAVSWLWPAVEAGLLLAIGDAYRLSSAEDPESLASSTLRFVHDRVQEDALDLLSTAERSALHQRAATLVRALKFGGDRDSNLFALVTHLNLSSSLIEDRDERLDLACLNLESARRAMRSAAYGHALAFLDAGVSALDRGDARSGALLAALHTESAESAFLLGDLDSAQRHARRVLDSSSDALVRSPAFTTLLLVAQSRGDLAGAIEIGVEAVRGLGVDLPRSPGMHHVGASLAGVKVSLLGRRVEGLLDLKRMNDPALEAAMALLERMIPAAFRSGSKLFPLLVLRLVSTSLRHGNAPASCFGYAGYAITLAGVLGDLEGGYRFGKLALALTDRLSADAFRPKVLFVFGNFIRHWKEPLARSAETLFDAYRTGLATGSVFEALWASVYRAYWLFCSGTELGDVDAQLEAIGDLVRHDATARTTVALLRQMIANLRGESDSSTVLTGVFYDEAEALPRLAAASDKIEQCAFLIMKCRLELLEGNVLDSVANADRAETFFEAITAMPFVRELHFYGTLARTRLRASGKSDGELSRRISRSRKLLETWATHEPGSTYRLALVDAEIARLEGRNASARDAYDRAISGARTSGMIHDEAYACERAADLYADHPVLEPALREAAIRAWRQWGARRRVEALGASVPPAPSTLREPVSGPPSARPSQSTASVSVTSSSSSSRGQVLDLASALKAAAALSAELHMDRLLGSMLKIILENTGASRGALLLLENDELVIQAESRANNEILVAGGAPLTSSSGMCDPIIRYVVRTDQEVVLADVNLDPRFASAARTLGRPVRSILCAPIRHQGRKLGVVYLENELAPGVFTADRLQLLSLLSAQAAIALENARLVANLDATVEARTRELNARNSDLRESLDLLATELRDAAAYVRSLLPAPLESPTILWRFTPSAHLGGDAFGYHWLTPDRLAIYLLDVAGHGIASALHSVAALTALQSQRLPGVDFHDPAAVLAALNRAFPREQSNGLYFTAWYGVLDVRSREIRSASAGHPVPVRVRSRSAFEIDSVGPMIGVVRDVDYETSTVKLAQGDRLFVFSDGVYEVSRPDGSMLDYEQFLEALVKDAVPSRKLESMEAFAREVRGGAGLEDDFSMLLLEL